MKRWIVAIAAGVLVILVPLLVVSSRSASAPTPATSPSTPPFEVGKTYGFSVSGEDLIGKVLAEPRDNWVKVEVRADGKAQEIWLNLRQVSYILNDPPADRERGRCQGPACCGM